MTWSQSNFLLSVAGCEWGISMLLASSSEPRSVPYASQPSPSIFFFRGFFIYTWLLQPPLYVFSHQHSHSEKVAGLIQPGDTFNAHSSCVFGLSFSHIQWLWFACNCDASCLGRFLIGQAGLAVNEYGTGVRFFKDFLYGCLKKTDFELFWNKHKDMVKTSQNVDSFHSDFSVESLSKIHFCKKKRKKSFQYN